MRNSILILVLLWVVSCKSPETKTLSHQVQTDTIFIPIADTLNFSFASIKQIDKDVLVCINDEKTSKLYLFTYLPDSIKDLRVFDLPVSLLDTSNGKIKNIDIISKESVLICQKNLLSIYNLKTKTLDFSYSHSGDDSAYYFNNNAQEISWNDFDNNILSIIYHFDETKKMGDTNIFFSGFLNPKTEEIEMIPINRPSVYQTSLINSMFTSEYIAVSPDYYVAAFGITPDLTVYNRKTKELKNIFVKSSQYSDIKSVDSSEFKDIKAIFNHYIGSMNFKNIKYDKFNKVYYRFYLHPIAEEDMNDEYLYEVGSKPLGVTILSDDFKIIGDLYLDDEIYPFNISIIADGLMQIQSIKEKNRAVVRTVRYEK
ncbi:MAG: DUF4221 family protein [Bacteroidales bacterium]|nr:DUF4221 family protein [Bacteroidales bacterium]